MPGLYYRDGAGPGKSLKRLGKFGTRMVSQLGVRGRGSIAVAYPREGTGINWSHHPWERLCRYATLLSILPCSVLYAKAPFFPTVAGIRVAYKLVPNSETIARRKSTKKHPTPGKVLLKTIQASPHRTKTTGPSVASIPVIENWAVRKFNALHTAAVTAALLLVACFQAIAG